MPLVSPRPWVCSTPCAGEWGFWLLREVAQFQGLCRERESVGLEDALGARVSAGSVTGAVALSEGMPADTGFWLRDLQWAAEEQLGWGHRPLWAWETQLQLC